MSAFEEENILKFNIYEYRRFIHVCCTLHNQIPPSIHSTCRLITNFVVPGERIAIGASGGKGSYSPNAYRGFAHEFIKYLERIRPRAILDIIKSGENFRISTTRSTTKMPEQGSSERCGYISSQKWCKACVLLEGLNRGLPKLGIGRVRGSQGDRKESDIRKSIESKQCGSLEF